MSGDLTQEDMADEEKQPDGREAPDPVNAPADKVAGQPTLHDIIAQQVEELRAKLSPEASLPDVTRLPQAAAPPETPGADVQTPPDEQEAPQAEAAAPGPDEPVDDAQAGIEERDPPQAEAADATSDGAPDQADPAEMQASEDVTPDEADEADEAREEELADAKLSLAEIIEKQAAELREKLGANAPEAAAEEAAEEAIKEADDVPAEVSAETDAQQADMEQGEVEEPEAGQEDEGPAPTEEQGAAPSETQQTLAEIIAGQREKLQGKIKAKVDGDPPGQSAGADGPLAPEAQTPSTPCDDTALTTQGGQAAAPTAAPRKRRLSLMTLFVGLNTVLIGVVTLAVLWFVLLSPRGDGPSPDGKGPKTATGEPLPAVEPLPPDWGGEARTAAEVLFEKGKFRAAAGRYGTLMRQAALRPADALARDLFATRYARCMLELGQTKTAREALGEAPRSESPILRAYAHHMLAVVDHNDGAYTSARRHAYMAIGALGAMTEHHGLVGDCEYVIARAMSAKVVANRSQKMGLPLKDLLCADPMFGTNDVALRKLLGNGVQALTKAGLDPSVGQFPDGPLGKRWMAAWAGPPVEQLLQKIATIGGQDVRWGTTDQAMRRRAVTLVFRNGVSQQRLVEVACGMVGLVARFVGDEIVIVNPRKSESMEIKIELFGREAHSMWRRYILADKTDDARMAAAHYALGRVHESMNNRAEALRAYQTVFNKYDESRVAPMALLRSAAIRQDLKDYVGARKDLLALIDTYPECGLFGQAYLNLGIVTRRDALQKNAKKPGSGDGLLDEAAKIFSRLYYLNVSLETRKHACLELADCLCDRKKYSEAAKWATIYIGHLDVGNAEEVCAGYLTLGTCSAADGALEEAAVAFYQVLGRPATTAQRREALLRLTPVQIKRRHYVGAIGALNRLEREELSPAQTLEYLVLLSESYRRMSLPATAGRILDQKQDSIRDQGILDKIRVELARCQIQMGEGKYPSARKLLRKALDSMIMRGDEDDKPSILAVHVELADLSLKLGEASLAIAGILPIVATRDCPDDLRRRARQILAAAYVREGKYAQAADALIDPKANGDKNDG